MMRFAPAAGLVLASPVVVGALRGQRHIDDALLAWLLAMAVAAAGLWLLQQVLLVTPEPEPEVDESGEAGTQGSGGQDRAGGAAATGEPESAGSPQRRRGDT